MSALKKKVSRIYFLRKISLSRCGVFQEEGWTRNILFSHENTNVITFRRVYHCDLVFTTPRAAVAREESSAPSAGHIYIYTRSINKAARRASPWRRSVTRSASVARASQSTTGSLSTSSLCVRVFAFTRAVVCVCVRVFAFIRAVARLQSESL